MFFKKKEKNVEQKPKEAISELEALETRQKVLRQMTFLGADSIKEYHAISNRINFLIEEQQYSEWFYNNKKVLELLFEKMKWHFFNKMDGAYSLDYKDDNTLLFMDNNINRDFLIRLLKRYNYKVEDKKVDGERVTMLISYEFKSW